MLRHVTELGRENTSRSAERVGQERAGKASELHPAGGTGGGNPSSQSSWYARVSKERCMRSSSSRSAADLALAAKTPHAAASRRCLNALDVSGPVDIALSFDAGGSATVSRPSAPGTVLATLGYANDPETIHLLCCYT
jgi:hypothetical protein